MSSRSCGFGGFEALRPTRFSSDASDSSTLHRYRLSYHCVRSDLLVTYMGHSINFSVTIMRHLPFNSVKLSSCHDCSRYYCMLFPYHYCYLGSRSKTVGRELCLAVQSAYTSDAQRAYPNYQPLHGPNDRNRPRRDGPASCASVFPRLLNDQVSYRKLGSNF